MKRIRRKKVQLLAGNLTFTLQLKEAQDGKSVGGIKLLYERPNPELNCALIRLRTWLNRHYTWNTIPQRINLNGKR